MYIARFIREKETDGKRKWKEKHKRMKKAKKVKFSCKLYRETLKILNFIF